MFAQTDPLIHYGIELSLVGGLRSDIPEIFIGTITEGIARQIMRLDDFGEVLVLEIDGGITGIVNGEINSDRVSIMEHGCFVTARIGNVEGSH